jgi:hypothetical protein
MQFSWAECPYATCGCVAEKIVPVMKNDIFFMARRAVRTLEQTNLIATNVDPTATMAAN